MLYLLINCAGTTGAIAAAGVTEVVPLVRLRPAPGTPSCIAGIMDYRGGAAPVIDMGLLLGGAACLPRLSTRILMIHPENGTNLTGLLAEGVNDTIDINAKDFLPSIATDPNACPMRLAKTASGIIQCYQAMDILNLLAIAQKEQR